MHKAILLRLMSLLYVPKIFMGTFGAWADQNLITRSKYGKKFTGELNIDSNTNLMKLDELKETCNKLNITINDLVMCSLSTSLKTLFEAHGDTST